MFATARTDSLSRVGWDQLESLLAIYYRGKGYRVDHVGTGATSGRFDGGIDLKLHKDDEYILVQCKQWNAGPPMCVWRAGRAAKIRIQTGAPFSAKPDFRAGSNCPENRLRSG